jgi:hypothetical protein
LFTFASVTFLKSWLSFFSRYTKQAFDKYLPNNKGNLIFKTRTSFMPCKALEGKLYLTLKLVIRSGIKKQYGLG